MDSPTESGYRLTAAVAIAAFTAIAGAAASAAPAAVGEPPDSASVAPPPAGQKIKMDEPMSGRMMKRGMTKGDVHKQAERKSQAMKPLMDAEEKAMPSAAKP